MTQVSAKIAPCLWFNGEAEDAAKFYASVIPNSHVDRVHKTPIATPGNEAGSVLFVEFTLGGQRFQALNGGTKFEFSYAISLSVECETQEEIDHLWTGLSADGGKIEQCGWLRDKFGVSWQIVPKIIPQLLSGDPAGARRVMETVMASVKLDIAELQRAYDGR